MFDNPRAKKDSATLTMATCESDLKCDFDKLFTRSVPHILEKIFFSLDYDSFMDCGKVCVAWEELHSSNLYKQEAYKLLEEKRRKEQKLCQYSYDGNIEEVQRLVRSGVKPNCSLLSFDDIYEDTPLLNASVNGHTEVVKLLLKFGADPNIGNYNETTPLHKAARGGHSELVKQLLDGGAMPDKQNIYGFTVLIGAAAHGHQNTVELLLEAGADPNKSNRFGETPLIEAAWSGYESLVKLLLKKGADPTRANVSGQTALSLAKENGHTNVAILIKDKMVDDHLYKFGFSRCEENICSTNCFHRY